MPAETMRVSLSRSGGTNTLVILLLFATAAILCVVTLSKLLPIADWPRLAASPDIRDIARILALESYLPRVAVSLLAGAGLALAGVIFQNVLRNPLAEPATLGVSAGAQLALVAATLWYPDLAGTLGAEAIALAGAGAAMLLVLSIGWGRMLSPTRIIIAGIFVSLYASAVSGLLVLFNQHYLTGIFLWSSGSLVQNGWSAAESLLIRIAVAVAVAASISRPLALLTIGDESARSLGARVATLRLAAIALAVALSASIVSIVGVIAFIGLAAPAIARAGGARSIAAQLATTPFIGAGLLCLADQMVQLAPTVREVPTGAATALFGAPLLLWLLPRLKATSIPEAPAATSAGRTVRAIPVLVVGLGALVLLVWVALAFGPGPRGWEWLSGPEFTAMLQWRWPRVLASGMAGAMLAVAGAIIQRVTVNPLASPEILGVSSGAALGLIVLLFVIPAPAQHWQFAAASAGASFILGFILLVGRRSGFRPEQLLFAGIAVGAMFGGLAAVLLASGDPRMATLLAWMAGSTYRITANAALLVTLTGIVLLALVPLAIRPLGVLPLGEATSRSVGVGVRLVRVQLLLLTAGLTAAATLTVGPLSFVGMMAPHLARLAGFQRPGRHLAASMLAGASIMIAADWLGRTAIFPYQIPAGLFATFFAAPFFLILLRRQK